MNGVDGVKKERFVVWQVEEKKFSVLSLDSTSGKPKQYCVTYNGYRWLCNCPHYLKNCEDVNFACKHIIAVMQVLGTQTKVEKKVKRKEKNKERDESLSLQIFEQMKRDKETLREITIEEIEKAEKPVKVGVIADRVFEKIYGEPTTPDDWVRIWHIGNQIRYVVENLAEEGLIDFDGLWIS